MSLIYSLIIILTTAILTLGSYFVIKKVGLLPIGRKLAVGALVVVAFYRYMVEREALYWVRGLNMTLVPGYEIPFGENLGLTFFAVILVWLSWVALFTIAINEFFEFETLRNIVKFFSVPVLILDIACFNIYATAIVGKDPFATGDLRIPALAVEICIALTLALSKIITTHLCLPNKKM